MRGWVLLFRRVTENRTSNCTGSVAFWTRVEHLRAPRRAGDGFPVSVSVTGVWREESSDSQTGTSGPVGCSLNGFGRFRPRDSLPELPATSRLLVPNPRRTQLGLGKWPLNPAEPSTVPNRNKSAE